MKFLSSPFPIAQQNSSRVSCLLSFFFLACSRLFANSACRRPSVGRSVRSIDCFLPLPPYSAVSLCVLKRQREGGGGGRRKTERESERRRKERKKREEGEKSRSICNMREAEAVWINTVGERSAQTHSRTHTRTHTAVS